MYKRNKTKKQFKNLLSWPDSFYSCLRIADIHLHMTKNFRLYGG